MKILWAALYGGRHRGSFTPAFESVARRVIGRGDHVDLIGPEVAPAARHDDVRALEAVSARRGR
jgi:hypothetical protein